MRQVAAMLGVGLVAAGTGCATPRTTIGVGVAALVTSAVLIATREDGDCPDNDEGCFLQEWGQDLSNGIVVVLAGGVGLTGLGFLASGTVSLYEESLPKPPLLRPTPIDAPAALGPEPAHAAGHERLALQIRLAARANRCPAAELMRQKLGELDAPFARSLTSDPFVAHCATANRPTALLE